MRSTWPAHCLRPERGRRHLARDAICALLARMQIDVTHVQVFLRSLIKQTAMLALLNIGELDGMTSVQIAEFKVRGTTSDLATQTSRASTFWFLARFSNCRQHP